METVQGLEDIVESVHELDTVLEKLRAILNRQVVEMSAVSGGYVASKVCTGMPGRPKFMVTENQLLYFVEHGFTAVDTSRMLGVSESTIRRRLQEFNIESTRPFRAMSDLDLDNTVKNIKEQFPNAGYRMMLGHLRSREIRVQQMRVRAGLEQACDA